MQYFSQFGLGADVLTSDERFNRADERPDAWTGLRVGVGIERGRRGLQEPIESLQDGGGSAFP